MSYSFPPEINRLVQDRLSSGLYASEDEILLEAMQTLRDRDEAVAAVQKGIADEAAGRVRSFEEVDAEMRKRYRIP